MMKKFISIILTLALCFMLIPVQSAYAAYYGENYDFTAMTDEQIEEAFFGDWFTYSYVKVGIKEDGLYYDDAITANWSYKGVTTVENASLSAEDFTREWEDEVYNRVGPSGVTKALKFELEDSVVYVHPYWEPDMNRYCLGLYEYNLETGEYIDGFSTMIRNEEIMFEEVLDKVLAGEEIPADKEEEATEDTSAEEPKEEETKEKETTEDTTAEEPKAEEETEEKEETGKKAVSKTKDGRDVYEGEEVYIVKKGDCLWGIAKQLLGNGTRYNELFTRNNGIVKKATLIFPGQEIIVPVK